MRQRTAAFFKLHPLLGGALVSVSAVLAIRVSLGLFLIIVIVVAAAAHWLLGQRAARVALGIAVVAGGWSGIRNAWIDQASGMLISTGRPPGTVHARMQEDGKVAGRGWSGLAKLGSEDLPRATVMWCGNGEVPVAGAEISACGQFTQAEAPRNPGEFDEPAWLERQGAAALFLADREGGTVTTGRWAAWAASLKRGFRLAVTDGLAEDSREADVIRAVVIGEYPKDDDEVVAAFRNSGTLHVFSVSGLHVAMVGMVLWFFLKLLGVPRRVSIPLLIALMFGYSWITGNSPPAVRSAWMAAVFLGAFMVRRRPDLLNALGAVLLGAAIWDGRLLGQAGVQLSYGVVAAIGLWGGWFSWKFGKFAAPDSYLPEILLTKWQARWYGGKRWVTDSVAVSCAAGLGSTPLTAWHFGLVTPVAVIASLFMIPVVFLLLVFGLLSAAVHPFSPKAACGLNQANAQVARICTGLAEKLAAIPYASVAIPRGGRPFLLIYDLEYGGGAVCFAGSDGAVLLDCGDKYTFKRVVLPSLRSFGVSPDSVVLSHPDGGHIGGGAALLLAASIHQVLLPVERSRSPAFKDWQAVGLQAVVASPGLQLPFPDAATLAVLHAPDPLAWDALADERVAIYRLDWRGWRILFVNDAGLRTERKLLASGQDLHADILIAGHHRTDLSLSDEFVQAVAPRVIIASNSPHPPEEQLDLTKVSWWEKSGIAVLDQRATGGVTITPDQDGSLLLKGFVDGRTLRLTPH
jgi:competence protein ComEC